MAELPTGVQRQSSDQDEITIGKSSVSELQCQFEGMLPVIYALRMEVIHAFGGTFSVTEKVIYTFLYMAELSYR